MDKHVKGLLSVLRQAINEAILGSHDVAAALAALGRTGHCPTFAVDVSLETHPREDAHEESREGEATGVQSQLSDEPALRAEGYGPLKLTLADEEFLRSLGINLEAGVGAVVEAPLK